MRILPSFRHTHAMIDHHHHGERHPTQCSNIKFAAAYLKELLWYLGTPLVWGWQLVRLLMFVLVLLPFFLPPTFRYVVSRHVHKAVRYGPSVRHAVDIYVPEAIGVPPSATAVRGAPVIVFVSGGAWIIGYRMWGFLMGLALQRRGILCVSVDYRNFPQSRIPEMVDDVACACAWVHEHIGSYGGDPANVSLVGQSAGAHVSALLLLRLVGVVEWQHAPLSGGNTTKGSAADGGAAAGKTAGGPHATVGKQCMRPVRWVGISGPYDLVKLVPALRQRGLHPGLMTSLACGDLTACSPTTLLAKARGGSPPLTRAGESTPPAGVVPPGSSSHSAVPPPPAWPPIALFHGTADRTVDWHHSVDFASALRAAGAPEVVEEYFADKSHTDPILEDPLLSGADPLLDAMVALVLGPSASAASLAGLAGSGRPTPMLLRPVLAMSAVFLRALHRVAKSVNPF